MKSSNDLNSASVDSLDSTATQTDMETQPSAPESASLPAAGAESSESVSLTELVSAAMDKATGSNDGSNEDAESPEGQAPADHGGDSTQQADSDSNGGASDASDSTPNVDTPPENWPEERRGDFDKLPADGRKLLLNIYGDMERGLHDSFQKLATQRKELENRFGLSVDDMQTLASRVREFRDDPARVLAELADEAGIDIFFNAPDDAIPEFDSQEDMLKWLRDDTQRQARQTAMEQFKSQREEQSKADTRRKLEHEFTQCHEQHPDMVNHREAIIENIAAYNLPVEQAYKLATWEGMTELVRNAQQLKQERDKAQAELERYRKTLTMPPGNSEGYTGKPNGHGGDMFENAWDRAQLKRQSQ